MTPRSGSSRIASGFSGRAAGTPDPRGIDGDPTEAHVVQGPTRREPGAAAAGGRIVNQPVRGPSWGVLPAWMRSVAAVSPAAVSQPTKNSLARASRKTKRAAFSGNAPCSRRPEERARQRSLASRIFEWVLQRQAGASRSCLPGRAGPWDGLARNSRTSLLLAIFPRYCPTVPPGMYRPYTSCQALPRVRAGWSAGIEPRPQKHQPLRQQDRPEPGSRRPSGGHPAGGICFGNHKIGTSRPGPFETNFFAPRHP